MYADSINNHYCSIINNHLGTARTQKTTSSTTKTMQILLTISCEF
ncbi:hypothetical protein SAMN02746098_01973 [Desulfosporosinus lacus DSM 15449]|uniref:Uncharacterized protein n=1 Tax=Desulfosporosinus lacus DSM 15449 TaxID=1121420 RepID=A0A1M5XEH9_9FIRM|nr:hypothetical protein SAMN02746098_01973 [Desulfosporosinus lacus DSM 15449]